MHGQVKKVDNCWWQCWGENVRFHIQLFINNCNRLS